MVVGLVLQARAGGTTVVDVVRLPAGLRWLLVGLAVSEPESKNLDWLAARPNVKFAMNLHSSGNYFMWSPGAYALPGRVSAPRPTLACPCALRAPTIMS